MEPWRLNEHESLFSDRDCVNEVAVNLSAELLPSAWYWVFNLIAVIILWLAWRSVSWSQLRQDRGCQHRLGFAWVLLAVIWSLRAGVSDGLGIHFFMVTTVHLMFGWALAVLTVFIGLLGLALVGLESWRGLGLNAITAGFVPILTTFFIWRWQERQPWHNPFAFILISGFAAAMASVLVSGLVMSLVYSLSGAYTWHRLFNEFWLFAPLIALPEGVLNGMIIAALVVFQPQWLALFNEQKYLPPR